MYFRFGCALVIVVLISLLGSALEKRNLELRRLLSQQQYQLDVLSNRVNAHRVEAQSLGAPPRLVDVLPNPPAAKPAESRRER